MTLTSITLAWRLFARRGWVVVFCALVVSCSSQPTIHRNSTVPSARPSVTPPDNTDSTHAVLDAHNAERTRHRLPSLVLNPQLTLAAEEHAADMAHRGKMSHRGGDGSSPFDRIEQAHYSFQAAAENVAYGFDQVDEVMVGWMHSAGHRRNILGPYSEIGVGRVIAPGGTSYWCVTFGRPASADFR